MEKNDEKQTTGAKKTKLGVSIDIETYDELELYCKSNFINRSRLVDRILHNFLKQEKAKK